MTDYKPSPYLAPSEEPWIRAEKYFDLAKMKRWFGTPPLFGTTTMETFDEFMTSLAACIPRGNNVIAQAIYQFGLEHFKMVELWKLHSESYGQQRALTTKEAQIEVRKERQHEQARELADEFASVEYPDSHKQFWMNDHMLAMVGDIGDALDEIKLAVRMEKNLADLAVLDGLMDACSKRAQDALTRIQMHSPGLVDRLQLESLLKIRGPS